MSEVNGPQGLDNEAEQYPLEPRYHPIHKIPRKIYDFLASSRLAMTLLVVILGCCLTGVTLFRGTLAGEVIFGTVWFNALLVLLVINVACCFFGRTWRRRFTLVSLGMILFHLSFVAIMLGIIYNSLFYFRGSMRLTEGEILSSGDPASYDAVSHGRFFRFSRLKGETSLIRMHTGYKVGGEDKRAAYEVEVGEAGRKQRGIIYITNKLTHSGVDYFNEKEGYSVLLILSNSSGKVIYGAHMPLQSIRRKNDFMYSTGYREENVVMPGPVLFPAPPEMPRMGLQAEYLPSELQERGGEMKFVLYSPDGGSNHHQGKPMAEGKTTIGTPFVMGEYKLNPAEIRYWVGMTVRYEPGKPIVLTSLCVGLLGMIITTVGRMMRGRK